MDNTFNSYETPYALVRMHGDGTYGHISAVCYNVVGERYDSGRPILKATCQIGAGDSTYRAQLEKTYAWKHGIDASTELLDAERLTKAATYMKKVERRVVKLQDDEGYPENFAAYLAGVLIASGVERVVVLTTFGGGYYGDIKDLPFFNMRSRMGVRDLKDALRKLEGDLIGRYARRAA